MNIKLKKIDVVILTILIIISVVVLLRTSWVKTPIEPEPPEIKFEKDDFNKKIIVEYVSEKVLWSDLEITGTCDKSKLGKEVIEGDEITDCSGTITITHIETEHKYDSWIFIKEPSLPSSLVTSNERVLSPKDEGAHYKNKLTVNREWWYYTVVCNGNNMLKGWTITISFNHMSRTDLFANKPDLLFVTLHSPDGTEYGGVVEKSRPILGDYSPLKEPSLQTSSSDKMFKVSFEDSYVQGRAPEWFIHIEGDIDEDNEIIMDLKFKSESPPLWTYSNRLIDKSKGNVASYIFMGCDVEGKVILNGMEIEVRGTGHHEHTWISGLLTSGIIRGWDWCHMTLENGWNIYYSNYYFTMQFKSSKTYKVNPFANMIITTDKGETLTKLENIKVDIIDSDKIFLLLNMPNKFEITAEPSLSQALLKETKIKLNLDIDSSNTFDKTWKRLAHVGMKIGRTEITGEISWSDSEGDYEKELSGIGTIWNMRH